MLLQFFFKDTGNPNISPSKRPKSVMGTEADLRKLKLSKARTVLRNFGVPEDEVRDNQCNILTITMQCTDYYKVVHWLL